MSDLSEFQRCCAEAYAKDPAFEYESFVSQYTLKHGVWWAPHDVLVLPDADALRQKVLHEMHASPSSGHVDIWKIRKAIERYYTWPSLEHDVEHYVNTCAGCQRNETSTQKSAGLLQPLPVPSCKWGSGSMDVITALPETASGNSAIVVLVDRLSKMTHLAACKTTIGTQAFAKTVQA